MVSDIKDLLEWAKAGTGDDLLSPEVVTQRHQYDTFLNGIIHYGISQFVWDETYTSIVGDYLHDWYGHTGGTFGFTSSAYKHPNGAAFASAGNSCGGDFVDNMMLEVYTKSLKERMELSGEDNAGIVTDAGAEDETTPGSSTTTSEGDTWTAHPRRATCVVLLVLNCVLVAFF